MSTINKYKNGDDGIFLKGNAEQIYMREGVYAEAREDVYGTMITLGIKYLYICPVSHKNKNNATTNSIEGTTGTTLESVVVVLGSYW